MSRIDTVHGDLDEARAEVARLRSEIAKVEAQRDSYCTQLSEEIGKTCQLEVEIALRDRALQWCLENGVTHSTCSDTFGTLWWDPSGNSNYQRLKDSDIPAEFAAILSGKADSEVAK